MDESILLGKPTAYKSEYDASLLYPISREQKRKEIGIESELPFTGTDIWNAYELSWLNEKGKPAVAMGEFFIPCISPNIVESKSFKLYLNSFNQSQFPDTKTVVRTMQDDLRAAIGMPIGIKLTLPDDFAKINLKQLPGHNIDHLDVDIECYEPNPSLLKSSDDEAAEVLNSNLLKSNCLVTGQPDWASIVISYRGNKIDRASLLKYIISFRNYNEFHEQCVERIYQDIITQCQPEYLTVYACYTRRGGLDINPFRSNFENPPANFRTVRQ